MKNRNYKKTEKGQIIVLLAVSLVVVMAVAALAVDGGMIYSERRFAQNAADASAMAGGGAILYTELDNEDFVCPANATFSKGAQKFSDNSNLIAKAYISARNVAQINNVSNLPFLGYIRNGTPVTADTVDINANHGVLIECNDTTTQKTIDVTVRITSQISTAFAHLVYPGDLQTTNEAVVRNEPGGEGSLGNAIVSLSPDCNKGKDGGIYVHGAGSLNIVNGGTFSNSCLYIGGNKPEGDLAAEGGFHLVDPNETYSGGLYFDWLHNPTEHVHGSESHLTFPGPEKPDCSIHTDSFNDIKSTSGKPVNTISPGNYDDIDIQGGNVNFEPGLYCLSGDFEATGGKVTGVDVTFYMESGIVHFNGNSNVMLVAPTEEDNEYYGLLFYFDGSGNKNNPILFNGNNASYFSGQVYAPDMYISVGGESEQFSIDAAYCSDSQELTEAGKCDAATFTTQFIGWQVTVGGNGNIDIIYNGQATNKVSSRMYLKD